MEDHEHPHTASKIMDSIDEILNGWTTFNEKVEQLHNEGANQYKAWETLIRYLEQNIGIYHEDYKKVSEDARNLETFMAKIVKFTEEVEILSQNKEIHELLIKQ